MSSAIARVVHVVDNFRVAINMGARSNVKVGDRYIIYAIGPEIIDPETSENLGEIQIVKGYGRVMSVQEKMATVESTNTETKRTRHSVLMGYEEREEPKPFDQPRVGDFARKVN